MNLNYINLMNEFLDFYPLSGLKIVLLHKQKLYPAVPVAYSKDMKETYENMKIILDKINYNEFKWDLCSDLKMVGIVSGLDRGYPKFPCVLCEWDSKSKEHFRRIIWPLRQRKEISFFFFSNFHITLLFICSIQTGPRISASKQKKRSASHEKPHCGGIDSTT